MASRRRSLSEDLLADDELSFVDDKDNAVKATGDVCATCSCSRELHDDDGECACGNCKRFKDR